MNKQSLKDFETFLENLSLKQSTIYRHKSRISYLEKEIGDVSDFDKVNTFFKKKTKIYTPSYLTSLSCSIRRWHQFLKENGLETDKRLRKYKLFGKKTTFIKATMTPEEIKAFLDLPVPVCQGRSRAGKAFTRTTYPKQYAKWTLFFRILAYTGMRTGEVAHLAKDDIDLGRQLFILRDTKTNTPRLVPIPQFLSKEIEKYLNKLTTKYLFPSQRGGNHNGYGQVFDCVDWHYNFHQRLKRLGIKRTNLTPYSLRHSFITRMIDKNVNLFNIQAIVGHRDIKTTAQYVHSTVEPLRDILNNQ